MIDIYHNEAMKTQCTVDEICYEFLFSMFVFVKICTV